MSEWQEAGMLMAIHKYAHSIKREPAPIKKRQVRPRAKDVIMQRRNARIVTAEFARSLKVAA